MGRPLKFNEERAARIVAALRDGCTRKAAYESLPIDSETFARWLKRFADFADRVAHAEAEAEAGYALVLKKAASGWDGGSRTVTTKTVFKTRTTTQPDGTVIEEPVAFDETTETVRSERLFDWRAAESWLRRRRREEWGDRLDVRHLSDDQIIRLLESEAAGGSGAPGPVGELVGHGNGRG